MPTLSMRRSKSMNRQQHLQERVLALNNFRKNELKKRYKSVKYFYKIILSALSDYCLSMLAMLLTNHKPIASNNDFLLLQSSEKVIKLNRKQQLKKELTDKNLKLAETYLSKPTEVLRKRRYTKPILKVPLRYYLYAAHAEWLISKYNPKIILNDRNGSIFSLFLKERINYDKGFLVHLAHATTIEDSRRLSMNEYDYYFLFGLSSYKALTNRKSLFGTSKIVLTGSHMIDQSFNIEPPNINKKTILLLGSGPDREKLAGYKSGYQLFLDWAKSKPEFKFLIKLHPRSKGEFWQNPPDNMKVLEQKVSLAYALKQASITVVIETNSVLEAGLCSRPIINIISPSRHDLFNLELFFGPPAHNIKKLNIKLERIVNNFEESVKKSEKFSQLHLANGLNGLNTTIDKLLDLLENGETSFDYELNGI